MRNSSKAKKSNHMFGTFWRMETFKGKNNKKKWKILSENGQKLRSNSQNLKTKSQKAPNYRNSLKCPVGWT